MTTLKTVVKNAKAKSAAQSVVAAALEVEPALNPTDEARILRLVKEAEMGLL